MGPELPTLQLDQSPGHMGPGFEAVRLVGGPSCQDAKGLGRLLVGEHAPELIGIFCQEGYNTVIMGL